jgi:dihydrodipicolinate synthase/N-acetylneuraminate lyase
MKQNHVIAGVIAVVTVSMIGIGMWHDRRREQRDNLVDHERAVDACKSDIEAIVGTGHPKFEDHAQAARDIKARGGCSRVGMEDVTAIISTYSTNPDAR